LSENYLFAEIAHRVSAWQEANPDQKLIRMGIGDVTRPIPGVVTDAMQKAAKELSSAETFRGYGPEQGYDFLRKAVQTYYRNFQVELDVSEIFISDGAKSDVGNIGDIFSNDNTVLITDPVYPVYVDSNLMSGRKVKFLTASRENAFLPLPEEKDAADLIHRELASEKKTVVEETLSLFDRTVNNISLCETLVRGKTLQSSGRIGGEKAVIKINKNNL